MEQSDAHIEVILDGISAVTEWLDASHTGTGSGEARATWRRFEGRLRRLGWRVPLGMLASRYDLSAFEVQCLVLALASALQLDGAAPLTADGLGRLALPTVGLAVETFCRTEPERARALQSFSPEGALRGSGLIELGPAAEGAMLDRPIAVPPEWLEYIIGSPMSA